MNQVRFLPGWLMAFLTVAVAAAVKCVSRFLSYLGRVAARRRDEEGMRRQAALIDLSPDAIITRTVDGTIKTWSKGAEKIYGWSGQEAVGKKTHALLQTEFPEPLDRIIEHLKRGQDWTGELIHSTKDGRRINVQSFWHAEIVDGELELLESNTDITQRKKAEEALRLQAAALDAAPNAISISQTDARGTIIWTNPAFTTLTGYSTEEIRGKNHRILHSGQQDETFYQELWDTISRGEVWRGELVNRRKDGTLYHEEMGITPLHDATGKLTHYVAIKQDITARKRAEETLRESEAQFRAFFENASVGASQIDMDGRFVEVNDRYCEITGYSRQELLGRSPLELTHPDDRKGHEEYFARFLRGEIAAYRSERRYVRKNGETIWVRTVAGLVHDASGKPWRSAAITEDITRRKQAEEALRESEERFRLALTASGIGWWHWDFTTDRLDGDDKVKELLGLGPEAALSFERVLEQTHPDDRPNVEREASLLRASPGDYEVEYRTVGPDESQHWVLAKGRSFADDAAAPPVHGMGILMDITGRKQIEEALRKSELFYRQTLASIPGMVFTTRPDGYCDYQSQQWVEYTGVPMSAQLGDGWNKLLHPEDQPRAFAAWRAAVEEKGAYDVEYRVRRFDGVYEWFKVRGQPIRDESGQVVRWFGVAANIEALKRAEISAEQAKAAAERANAAKDQFLAVLSHELRTPLAPVLAGISLLKQRCAPCEVSTELEILERNVQLEARLIDDLLDLTRIERGKISLDRKVVYLCTVLDRVAEICTPDISRRQIQFSVNVENAPHPVRGDVARLQQIFWNVLNNAIKFSREGGMISLHARRQNGEALVEVRDAGIGIEAGDLSRIFNAFEQGDNRMTRQFGGLGLGLAITKRLVEMHGGRITAHSAGRNRGATFIVALPLAEALGREDVPPISTEPRRAPAAGRILLVEDHSDTAVMMKELLQISGYEVETAADVAQSLKAAEAKEFDLLISDLGLPDRSGLELMEELQQRQKPLKGIALSGFGREEDVRRSKEAGFTEHLTKPVDFDTLLAAVERVI